MPGTRKYFTKSDEKTHRFIRTLPGFGRGNNSNHSKWLRWFEKHPATVGKRRKKHGRQ